MNLSKLMLVVGGLRKIVGVTAPDQGRFSSIDDVLFDKIRPKRKCGSHS